MKKPSTKVGREPILVGGYSLFSILAFISGFIFWPIGFVFGLMALDEIKNCPGQISVGSKYLAWLGILIQPLFVLLALLVFRFLIFQPMVIR